MGDGFLDFIPSVIYHFSFIAFPKLMFSIDGFVGRVLQQQMHHKDVGLLITVQLLFFNQLDNS